MERQMSAPSKLSIIVITYNNFDELLRTLDSLKPFSSIYNVVVINGGTCEKTRSLLQKDQLITSISEPDEGIADAFNKGVKAANSGAVTFLNSGDIMLNNEFYEDALHKINSYDLVFGNIDYDHGKNGVYTKRVNRNWPLASFNHQALVYKKDLALSHPFNKTYSFAMDYEQILRCLKDRAKYTFSDKKSIKMYSDGTSHSHPFKTIASCYRAIYENKYFSIRSLFYVGLHNFKILIRYLLPESITSLVLKLKYKN